MRLSRPAKRSVEGEMFKAKLISYLLIMIHQMEGILLIRIKCNDIGYSYETKSKSLVIGDDFCRVEASVNESINEGHLIAQL